MKKSVKHEEKREHIRKAKAKGMQSKFEEQFTAYIDLLGFKEAVSNEAEQNISAINGLLTQISKMRSEFSAEIKGTESNQTIRIVPMITTYSDHIVISYPLQRSYKAMGDTKSTLIEIIRKVNYFTAQVAKDALRIGLLVRGGATIGKLCHTPRVIFGKALNDAYSIECSVSKFPRVVLSAEIASHITKPNFQELTLLSEDGCYHLNYFKRLAMMGSTSAKGDVTTSMADREAWAEEIREAWAEEIKKIVSEKLTKFDNQIKELASKNLTKLEDQIRSMKQIEYLAKTKAKWAWFDKEFCSGVERSKCKSRGGAYATEHA